MWNWRKKKKDKLLKEKRQLYDEIFSKQLDDFTQFIKKIEPLLLFATLFIAVLSILWIQSANQDIPKNIQYIFERTEDGIAYFLMFIWFIFILYWLLF